ncbi:DUF1963 domain-containing protein [Phytomonospora sp. NPDC050363]|uniref:DUF1963 domain-containing protein n=1 Tax=Phytomonospora sp. NPDC050363 TaxID=3155642 RepID=UPI0033F0BF8E
MDRDAAFAALQQFCADRLGAELAAEYLRLARPGFSLTCAEPGEATGECRFGGRAMLAPGTPWPRCDGHPLSLIAVLDTDALGSWLDGIVPPGTGLLNFFCLDSDSDHADPVAFDIAGKHSASAPQIGVVIAAPAATAVETGAPERASEFEAEEWKATAGFCFPDDWDPAWNLMFPGTGADHYALRSRILDQLTDWDERPGAVVSEDIAFGRPQFPTGSAPYIGDGSDPNDYHHLLQLGGNEREWFIGGEGGVMHWSIPSAALRAGDFSRAVPTPDHF